MAISSHLFSLPKDTSSSYIPWSLTGLFLRRNLHWQHIKNNLVSQYLVTFAAVASDLLTVLCRIHYPLPLPYVGKPDPAALQKEVRALKAELGTVSSHGINKSAELEIQRLRAE